MEKGDVRMAESEKLYSLYSIFKQAIQDERAAQAAYKRALSICEDDFTRQVFQQLYDDELRHERILVERYNSLRPIVEKFKEA